MGCMQVKITHRHSEHLTTAALKVLLSIHILWSIHTYSIRAVQSCRSPLACLYYVDIRVVEEMPGMYKADVIVLLLVSADHHPNIATHLATTQNPNRLSTFLQKHSIITLFYNTLQHAYSQTYTPRTMQFLILLAALLATAFALPIPQAGVSEFSSMINKVRTVLT